MSMEERRKPYIWPTWISPLLSGDKHCEWAAWCRAHYFYTKREEPSRENALSQWKADHARFVSEHADALTSEGWSVRFEDQNKFSYYGKAATVGGCPDIVATKPGIVRIDDAKTGRPRDSDYWQVAIYGMLLPLVDESISELVTCGAVVYKDRVRALSPQDIVRAQPLIIERIKRTSADQPPARTPSASECGFCDIADCPDRIEGGEGLSAEGDIF